MCQGDATHIYGGKQPRSLNGSPMPFMLCGDENQSFVVRNRPRSGICQCVVRRLPRPVFRNRQRHCSTTVRSCRSRLAKGRTRPHEACNGRQHPSPCGRCRRQHPEAGRQRGGRSCRYWLRAGCCLSRRRQSGRRRLHADSSRKYRKEARQRHFHRLPGTRAAGSHARHVPRQGRQHHPSRQHARLPGRGCARFGCGGWRTPRRNTASSA